MAKSIHDYLLPQDGIDWSLALRPWYWLLPPKFALWMVNRFAECILVLPDGSVHVLQVGEGELERLADSQQDFHNRIVQDNHANEWQMIPLVDEMVDAGNILGPGQCYGFKLPPIVGGGYARDNTAVKSIVEYLAAFGSIHEQMKDLSDGTKVTFEIIDSNDERET